jgi:hypothetical protein
MRLGIGLGLILASMSGTVHAQTIYNSIGNTHSSIGEIKLYDRNRLQIEQKPRPEKETTGHRGSKNDNKPQHHLSILDRPSG